MVNHKISLSSRIKSLEQRVGRLEVQHLQLSEQLVKTLEALEAFTRPQNELS